MHKDKSKKGRKVGRTQRKADRRKSGKLISCKQDFAHSLSKEEYAALKEEIREQLPSPAPKTTAPKIPSAKKGLTMEEFITMNGGTDKEAPPVQFINYEGEVITDRERIETVGKHVYRDKMGRDIL